MKTVVYHILPHTQGWAVRRSGASRSTAILPTLRSAEKFVNRIFKRLKRAHCLVHDKTSVYRAFGVNKFPPVKRMHRA